MEYFLGCYEFIEKDLRRMVDSLITTGKTLNDFNSNFISLIPEDDNPTSFKTFMPISLCNCIYTVISQLIARR
jgi:hypothetical protein